MTGERPAGQDQIRALHVIGGGDTGGAMAHLLPLLVALQGEGCSVELLCLGEGGLVAAARARSLPTRVLPMVAPWDARMLPRLRRALAAGWDVVHTHGMRANLPVRLLLRTLRRRPCLITTVHSDLALDYSSAARARAYLTLDRLSARLVDRFLTVSGDLGRLLVARGYPPERIVTVHSGVELSAPGVETGSVPDSLRAKGLLVGTVARLVPVKDLELLLEVALRLRPSVPQVRFLIIGEGPERSRLESRARELGLADVVTFCGEVRPARAGLEALDVYLITSLYEGVPMSVLEVMSLGRPVVATDVGGLREVLVEGRQGYLVSRNRPRAEVAEMLAERVKQLLIDPSLRARMGKAASERARSRFSVRVAARATLDVYHRCLAESLAAG